MKLETRKKSCSVCGERLARDDVRAYVQVVMKEYKKGGTQISSGSASLAFGHADHIKKWVDGIDWPTPEGSEERT